ncbi:MAG: FG-GAP repeat protein, partial [Bacteroidota bacterium]
MRTLFLITLIYAAFTTVTWAQVQIGENLLGEAAGDHFGSAVSLSADGQRLAVGAWRNSEVSPNAGRVYVYEENAGTWETISDATAGSSNDDRFGYAVSL